MKKSKSIALVLACLGSTALASVETSFRILRTGDAPAQLQMVLGEESVILDVPDGSRSKIIHYQGPRALRLWEPVGGGRVYEVTLRKDRELQLVILGVPAPQGVLVLADDLETHPLGGFRFVNASDDELTITFGGEKAELAPGTEKLFPRSEASTVFVQIARATNEEVLFSNNWSTPPTSRSLLLITPSAAGELRILRVTEGNPPKQ